MNLLANLALFFVLFLPLCFLVGLPGDLYIGPNQEDGERFPLMTFLVYVLPTLAPAVLFVPVAHFALRFARRRVSRSALRAAAVVLLPVGILAVHLAVWGDVVLSAPLLLIVLLPGALYGLVFRIRRAEPL